MIIASRMHFVNVSLECIFFFTYFMFGMTNFDVFVLNDLDFGQANYISIQLSYIEKFNAFDKNS